MPARPGQQRVDRDPHQRQRTAADGGPGAGAPGGTGSTNNQVTLLGTAGANTFTVAGSAGQPSAASDPVTANSLETVARCRSSRWKGRGQRLYTLNSSAMPTAIVDSGGYNTLDLSNDTKGVHVNLGLDQGQAQSIAPWGTTLSINGLIDKLVGTQFADVLTGGPAATTEIVGGAGNDTITGGSGNNILLGGGGNDTITGGSGRNLIIAGSGNCNLYAAGSRNIIFAGTTNMDSNDQALLALLEDGSRISYGYTHAASWPVPPRVRHCCSGGHVPGHRRPRHDLRQQLQQLARARKIRHAEELRTLHDSGRLVERFDVGGPDYGAAQAHQ